MLNKEYLKIAEDLLRQMENPTIKEATITNISEVFITKCYDSILEYGKKKDTYTIAKEVSKIITLNWEEEKENKTDYDIQSYSETFSEEKCEELKRNVFLGFFRIFQYTIEELPNAEQTLYNIGFNNAREIINEVKNIEVIHDEQTYIDITQKMQDFNLEIPDIKFFIILSCFYFCRDITLKMISTLNDGKLLQYLKTIKNTANTYKLEYSKRIEHYAYIVQNLDDFFDLHAMALIRLLNRVIPFIENNKISIENINQHIESKEISNSVMSFLLDISFIYYYFSYQQPKYVINFIFNLLHVEQIPLNFKQVLRKAFQADDYAPIFQYEYEWYCQQNNINSIVPIRFYFGEPVDLKSFGIEDYDFWNTKTQEIPSVQHCISKPKEIPVNSSCIEYPSKNISINEYQVSNHLSYPLVLGQLFSGAERRRVINALYKKLNENYIQCSSMEYFSYVFGMAGIGKSYKPKEDDYINWIAGKRSLQCLIIKLYRPDGARQIVRNTWTKVENCFLLDGKTIPSETMKLETNHITNSCKEDMNILISDLIKEHTS